MKTDSDQRIAEKIFQFVDLKGKKVLLSVVPSLDTGICDLQTKRFNHEASSLGDDVVKAAVDYIITNSQ